MTDGMDASHIDLAEYCRHLETYLCRKNEGHLVRIAGPVFEQVCRWAAQGVPLAIAYRGVDRYCERYYAKAPRRRPVRIEFCEADILELFDDWRRAVGVSRLSEPAGSRQTPVSEASEPGGRRDTLPLHLDRAIARLTAVRAGGRRSAAFDGVVDEAVGELDRHRTTARATRGEARQRILDRLAALDRALVEAAAGEAGEDGLLALRREAEAELAPFAVRMPPAAYARAVGVAADRLLRDAFGLPTLTFE